MRGHCSRRARAGPRCGQGRSTGTNTTESHQHDPPPSAGHVCIQRCARCTIFENEEIAMLKQLLLGTALTIPIALAASPASALLTIAFQANGAGAVSSCSDGAACDNSGLANQILQFNQNTGQFNITGILTESTKVPGSNSLDLTSLVITNNGPAGFLTIVAGDNNFIGPINTINESGSGTFKNNIGATATLSFFADAGNTQPSGTGLVTPGTNLFNVAQTATQIEDSQSGTNLSAFFAGGAFSMAEKAVLEFDAGGSVTGFSQGMQQVAAVPEPSTWAMMLLGLLGVSMFGVARKRNGRGFR